MTSHEPAADDPAIASLRGALCLVTGGAGFIGSHLVDALRGAGARVRVLDNLSTGYQQNLAHLQDGSEVEFLPGDAADHQTAVRAVRDVDVVFHHAAMASVPRSMREPQLCHAWCATSTVELLDAAARGNARRFVLASTSAVYGDSPYAAKREADLPAPLSPYAAAKLAAESYCQAFDRGWDLQTVVLRYFNVFGPRQDPQSEYSAVIPRFVSTILSGERPIIYGDGAQSRDFVFVGDVARANLLAATVPDAAGGTFNVGRGQRTSLLELLQTLRTILDRDIQPRHESPRLGDVRDSLADISAARAGLRYEPTVSIEQGLRDSIDYYRSLAQSSMSS